MANGFADVCVCVLFYGADDYCYQLAQQVLNEPMRQLAGLNVEFRFGLNAVGPETREHVQAQIQQHFVQAIVVDSPQNIYKYPMMRRLLHDTPIQAPVTMWFDDNSRIAEGTDVHTWLRRILAQLESCDMLGSVYRYGLQGNQADWVRDQPWFADKEPGPYVQYAAGGWWAIKTDALNKFNWPSSDIQHHGGAAMLGELVKQQDMLLCHFRDNVLINTNASGVEAAPPRRGFSAPPVGFNYVSSRET